MIKDFFKGLRAFLSGFFRPFSMDFLQIGNGVKYPLAFRLGEITGFVIVVKITLVTFIYMVVAL